MDTYPKIQTLFKRDQDGPHKGRMIRGAWTTPELEYLATNTWEFTEKVDGTNIRVEVYRVEDYLEIYFAGRTDNAVIPTTLLEHLQETFPEQDPTLGHWMVENDIEHVILFGEGYGPKIQSGGKYRDDASFVLFDVKIGNWWMKRESVNDIAKTLHIDSVPVIGRGSLQDAIDIVETGLTFPSLGGIKRWGRNGLYSKWGDFEAEGIVARPVVDLFDRAGNRIITKIKAVDFK